MVSFLLVLIFGAREINTVSFVFVFGVVGGLFPLVVGCLLYSADIQAEGDAYSSEMIVLGWLSPV